MKYRMFLLVVSVLLLGAGCLPASNQSNSQPAETDATPEVKSTTENSLNLSNNQMTGVPAEVGQLQDLEVLDLSYNQLTGLPHELGNLKKLKTLNISGNNYSEADLKKIQEGLSVGVNIIK